MKLPIYFDYASTTPMDYRVLEKMKQCFTLDGVFGNPASRSHYYGWQAEDAVDLARSQIATLIGANSREIIFTSGSTESNNLAIKGVVEFYCKKNKCHIITSLIEHKSVLNTCQYLESQGVDVTYLVPQQNGLILLNDLNNFFRKETILVSIMHVNNEIGIVQDIEAIGNLCRRHGVLFHVDAAQSIGKLPVNLVFLPIDLMSFSAHKLYGPKGIGCLYVRQDAMINIQTQMHGGGHERGIRSGTLPVHQVVGMGEACRILQEEMSLEISRLFKLRNRFWKGLQRIDGIILNGSLQHGVATLLNICFPKIKNNVLISALKDIAISYGSACVSNQVEPSYVLKAIGLSDNLAYRSIRISFGRFTTIEEIDYAIYQIRHVISGLYEMDNLGGFV
ncbi:IscS subfamily cysteine desulfurase [Blochmannia endosymbiont of Camponotus (Colobopsis) obliquus]|uniref:IscS subfamily cysteine desulfurase n=1 Tax=Blochmannia endosymbiont of Camponotus (Colobopsis) obliquus TaxID=1505597 RepID=UPI00061AAE46|nr:IscS subfamily cysteine desulfurase [Blochmannia endosymbiont of Camponotus (Colobopsis) obliquus]